MDDIYRSIYRSYLIVSLYLTLPKKNPWKWETTVFQTSRASSSRALFCTEPAGLEAGYLEMHPTHATFSVETFPRKPPKTSHRVIMENELHRRRKMPATVSFGGHTEIPSVS